MLTAHREDKKAKEEKKKALAGDKEEQEQIETRSKYRKAYATTKRILQLDPSTLMKAVASLQHHAELMHTKDLSSVTPADDFIHVCIQLSQRPEKIQRRPIKLPLDHPIYSAGQPVNVCLIVNDDAKYDKQLVFGSCVISIFEYKNLMAVSKGKDKLAKLAQKHELMLADINVYKMLPKAVKDYLTNKNKCPYPVNLSYGIEQMLEDTLSSAYLSLRNRCRFEYVAGRVSLPSKATAANILRSLPSAVAHVLMDSAKHTTVQSILLKTRTSIELPIYTLNNEIPVPAPTQ